MIRSLESDKNDRNGKDLLECIEKYNLFIHNYDTYTHIDNTSKSNIDLVITTGNFSDKIDPNVHNDTWVDLRESFGKSMVANTEVLV